MNTVLAVSIVTAGLIAAQCGKRDEVATTGGTTNGTGGRPCETVVLGDSSLLVYASENGDSVLARNMPRQEAATRRPRAEATKDTLPKPRAFNTCLTLYARGDTLPKP